MMICSLAGSVAGDTTLLHISVHSLAIHLSSAPAQTNNKIIFPQIVATDVMFRLVDHDYTPFDSILL